MTLKEVDKTKYSPVIGSYCQKQAATEAPAEGDQGREEGLAEPVDLPVVCQRPCQPSVKCLAELQPGFLERLRLR